jgi:ADP-ribose pyrophosphatase YjhB (NUDIX family)
LGVGVKNKQIRVVALCVFLHTTPDNQKRIFVGEGHDPHTKTTFYRPLGGAIEFGERGEFAIKREIREEVGAEIYGVRYLGLLENIYRFNGRRGHEISLIYDATFADKKVYELPGLKTAERPKEGKGEFRAMWYNLDAFRSRNQRLYPSGLFELLLKR